MNSQQYNRANKRVFLAAIIVFAYIAFTLFAAFGTKEADATRIIIQLVAAIAVIVIAVIALNNYVPLTESQLLEVYKSAYKSENAEIHENSTLALKKKWIIIKKCCIIKLL